MAAGAVSLSAVAAQAATITVNSLADNTTAGDAQCTIREALANSNSNSQTTSGDCVAGSGADTINLTGLAGTITLGGTQLPISDSTTLTGPGAATLTIDGATNSRVFYIYNNASALNVSISGITVTRGRAANGGNIISKGEVVTLNSVTLSSGVATAAGGGFANVGGSLTLQSSTISGNTAQGSAGGGGIYNVGGALTVTDSTVTGNSASTIIGRGGAISILSTTQPTAITNSQITNNSTSGKGGALAVKTTAAGGTLTIDHSVVSGSTATGRGGAFFLYRNTGAINITQSQITTNTTQNRGGAIFLYNAFGNVTISDSTLSGNSAPSASGNGGAIFFYRSAAGVTLKLERSTISGNSTARAGGGIFFYKGSGALAVVDSTIANNTAGTSGGAIFDRGPFGGAATLTIEESTISGNSAATSGGNLNVTAVPTSIQNSIIANGTAPSGPDALTGGSNVTMNYSLLENTSGATFAGSGNITGVDPNLGPLQDNGGPTFTLRPATGSPVLDAGDPAFVPPPATDQRGLARVYNGRIDMGSLEQGAQSTFSLSTSGATVSEAGGSIGITVNRSSGEGTASVTYSTSNGTAQAGADYTATSGTVTFAAGDFAPKTITVPILEDTIDEPSETFSINLSTPSNGTLTAPSSATITITDNDPSPAIAISGVTQAEGNAGSTSFNFVVTLSNPSSSTVTVNYATSNGTATAADYTPQSGTITFAPGITVQTVSISVLGDTVFEGNETFNVTLSSPTNATIGTSSATGTINNDDPAPTLSIGNVTQAEGNSGTTSFVFPVTLSAASGLTTTVNYTTANGTATSGSDFTATTGTLTFAPGVTTQNITVPVLGDTVNEADETFTVVLSAPTNATIASSTGTGTITNDDAVSSVSIGDVAQAEGNSGTTTFSFPVTLSAASGQTVTVNYATANGTAVAGSDYTAASGTVTFAPGETSKTVTVLVNGDTTKESNESFTVTLSAPVNATLGTATGTGTINDDDTAPVLAIGSVSQAEGNSGTTTFSFPVTLSVASGQTVTVNYATANGTAIAGSDYGATSGTLTFAPGVTSQTVNVPVTGDVTSEASETFTVTLSAPSNATIGTASGTGTIVNDDAAPVLSIADASQAEGNSGAAPMPFAVTLSAPSEQTITVNYSTANGSAVAGSDFTATSGTLTFAPGVTSQTINVPIQGDTTAEPDETFTVVLDSPVNAAIGDGNATGTIVNDDAAPTVSIGNVSQAEGDSGTTNFTFAVTLSAPSSQTVTVAYATSNGSATAGSDYAASSGTVTFAPGVTSQSVTVPVFGDTTSEPNETFTVTLSAAVNATTGTAVGTGTIVDDDSAPVLTVNNVSAAEGNSGSTTFTFVVTLSAPSGQTVTVNYATANGTATAGGDYGATSGTLTFAPGVTSQTVNVPVTGDATNEADETFTVTLSAPSNATIATATGTGTIVNDDAAPAITISDASQAEGNSGTANMPFAVTLSAPSEQTVTVNYATANGSALAGSDYTATSGVLTFAPGVTVQTVNVPINGDTTSEPNETFTVVLTAPSNASIADASGTGTIVNDDAGPAVSIGNVSQAEGSSGTSNFSFAVTLSAASEQTVTVNYATSNGSAIAGSDYVASSGTVTFAPGVTSQTITVPVLGDTTSEPAETFNVTLSAPVNATIGTAVGTGTIVDDDSAPVLTIGNVSQAEGNSGSTTFSFPVSLSAPSGQTVTVNYATANGTAIAGSDYGATSGTLTFAPGVTSQTVNVPVTGDLTNEADETFSVVLSSSTNAPIATATGTGTIVNDDAGPAITISDASQAEGDSGVANMPFAVMLSAPSEQTVTVNYATSNGTAAAGSDYTASSGVVTFAPGVTVQSLNVPINGDTTSEPNETFTVVLSAASNAAIADASGTGTIVNDDSGPSVSIGNVSQAEGSSGTSSFTFTVTLSAASDQAVTVNYATSDGSAIAGSDYVASSGTVTFAPGVTSQTITVPVLGDTTSEPAETFNVTLSAPVNATIGTAVGTGTIVDDDSAPVLTIGNVSQAEGNSGSTTFSFPVTLSSPSGQTVTVQYATANGTAIAGSDYGATSGTLTFAPGVTSQTVNVPVTGDLTNEADETFSVVLSSSTNAPIATATGTGTIVNDDAGPAITISDASQAEGDSGVANMPFAVMLSAPSEQTVTVNYATSNGTAAAGSDYTASSGVVTFAPGVTVQSLNVPINGDTTSEPNETFTVVLSGASNASIADASATGTILDDDAGPAVSIGNVSQAEGNSGTSSFTFAVTLSAPSEQTVTVQYATSNGTAVAGSDYVSSSGTVTFAPGVTSQSVTVAVNGDTTSEPNETFSVTLSAPVNATIGTAVGTGTIVDDDSAPVLTIGNVSQAEGNSGTTTFSFPVTLSSPSGQTVTVQYATANGTAIAGSDYGATSGTLTFAPGVTSQTVNVPVIGDTVSEPDETFTVTLSSSTNAPIATATGTGTIVNDDSSPALSISDAAQAEGNSGTSTMPFAVTLSTPSEQTVTVQYTTVNGSATAGSDYTATSGTLTFAPGVTVQSIAVPILGDTLSEPDETFSVVLSAPVNAAIADSSGTGTIETDDAPYVPSVSVSDVSVTEGDAGTTAATFTVTLDAATTQPVSVDYATADGTAQQGSDYVAAQGTLFFPAGTTSRTVTVNVLGDEAVEPNETFTLNLSAPSGATIATPRATGTILNDDSATPTARISIADTSVTEGDAGLTDAVLTVTLNRRSDVDVTVDYATSDGTARSGSDYAVSSGSVVFPAGTTSRVIHIPVLGDTVVEDNETFLVRLSNARGANLSDNEAVVTIVNDDVPSEEVADRGYIAIAGATPGAGGSFFRTALQLHNDSDAPATGTVVFHLTSGGTPAVVPYTLAPHQTLALDDAAFTAGIGSADLIPTTGPVPVAAVRIISTSACGTVGLSTQSLDPARDALTAPDRAVLLAPSDLGQSRFNIGIRPITHDATLRLTLYDRDGHVKARLERTFTADLLVHTSAADLLGTAIAADDSILIEMTAGTAIVYGATTDNSSQDPSLQLARPLL